MFKPCLHGTNQPGFDPTLSTRTNTKNACKHKPGYLAAFPGEVIVFCNQVYCFVRFALTFTSNTPQNLVGERTSEHVQNPINLVSNDVQRLRLLFINLTYAATGVLEVTGCITAMWFLIGWQALVGIAFFPFVIAYNVTMATHASRPRHRAARIADKRLGIIGEIIQGIRAVKNW